LRGELWGPRFEEKKKGRIRKLGEGSENRFGEKKREVDKIK